MSDCNSQFEDVSNFLRLAEAATLASLEEEAETAVQQSKTNTPHVLQVWWEQPAMNAVPWVECELPAWLF